MSEPTSVAVVAEKPSVARDIARVLGAARQGEGYLHGNGYVVTWAIGHLAALAQPHEINPAWRQWRRDTLPMLPRQWPLVVYDKTRDQFEVVRKILNSPRIREVICATDAGREGELIFRYIYEAAHSDKPVLRLWISSLTPEAIRKGLDRLAGGSKYDPLADAARGRSRADWLVGMNLSRAYSLAYGEDLSVGRVQTPTLAMLVERELAIRQFVPEDYLEVIATFHPTGAPAESTYLGTWFRRRPESDAGEETLQKAMRLAPDGEEARLIAARARGGEAAIESIEAKTNRMAPLPLYDLTELQRHANRLFGLSAQQTLDTAQTLYERHKLISYPRTDSRHLSADVAATLPRIIQVIAEPYREHLAPGTGERPLGRRFVDDAKVTDHHAIIPTTTPAGKASLTNDERRIYDLICRRLLSAWHDDYIWRVTTIITAIRNGGLADRYHSSGTAIEQAGWKVLDVAPARNQPKGKTGDPEQKTEQALPAGLTEGQPQDVTAVETAKKKTRPPRRFSEATLLTAMETAGRTLDEKELSDAMKETGLGTPATRAAIIEVLLKREYIRRSSKNLEATDKGIRLIEVVHPEVKSPVMTGQWEACLSRIEKGNERLDPFLEGIENYVREVVGKVGGLPAAERHTNAAPEAAAPATGHARMDAGDGTPIELLNRVFGYPSFRPNQEAVCQASIDGKDVLLVMPTGSGKSLCYQLPGIARGGTTLVISPLIALMEDQVAKLMELGIPAGRIHSGRDRNMSRQTCIDYLNGDLRFLFIAPERFSVSGFAEMLAKSKPSLIAVDEAHCISQWGHDFRPDYRMLGQYLPKLRPAPLIALTATATPLVQDDIARQLEMPHPERFIHGFRRDNVAIEAVEVAPSLRAELVANLLEDSERRPGIVYAPTRKQVTALAAALSSHFHAAAYHAGLDGEHRQRVQQEFLAGRVEVMVATIAFGMGIDKPDIRTVIHTALPGSLEAYYQEIGRAGRDGEPSRAVLMHSYADRYTHDFFFERDYPDVSVLDTVFRRLQTAPVEKAALQKSLRIDPELFDKAIEKLWINGGAVLDYAENASRGHDGWREAYLAHVEQKRAQIDLMIRFAESSACRMAALVRHFGDFADGKSNCGICDFCAPDDCVAQRFRPAREVEKQAASRVLDALAHGDRKSTGKLHGELFKNRELSRDEFEELAGAMARAGLIRLAEAVFEKEGRQIPYRTISLTPLGMEIAAGQETIELVLRETVAPAARPKRKARKTRKTAPRVEEIPARAKIVRPPTEPAKPAPRRKPAQRPAADTEVWEALRAWRLNEARARGVPAFRIMSDKVLHAIAEHRPSTTAELLAISGIGINTVEKYGRHIYRILEKHG
ncbi:MAG: DNA topoisomerase 3 [Bryobacterales bacterium]|nr:DNA topoisomerase 3 [Bryobacterales bacterium]